MTVFPKSKILTLSFVQILQNGRISWNMCAVLYNLLLPFKICFWVGFNLIKLRRFYQILLEQTELSFENLGEKYLKEPFIHAYANLHSIHTNKQEDANIETQALGSNLSETKRTNSFLWGEDCPWGISVVQMPMHTRVSSEDLACLFEQQ